MRAQREEEKKNGSKIGEIAARSHEIERDSWIDLDRPR